MKYKNIFDTHTHSINSFDGHHSCKQLCEGIIKNGGIGIAITDHCDIDGTKDGCWAFEDKQFAEVLEAKKAFPQIKVCNGVELGQALFEKELSEEFLSKYDFDYIIGSSHLVNGQDPYYPEYFQNRTEALGYRDYFETIPQNLAAFKEFDSYGHIDYVVRYGPNTNKFYSYKKFSDIIDEILRTLISMGKGIEINTGGFKYGLGHPNPTEEIIARYHELGGEIITMGADAHAKEHVAYAFDKVPGILKNAGFRYYTVFEDRKPVFLPLP